MSTHRLARCSVLALSLTGLLGFSQALPAQDTQHSVLSTQHSNEALLLAAPTNPIDLTTALQLAGVENPEILLARERVVEAVAVHQLAAAQILPTLNAGTNFSNHNGPLQTSTGTILKVDRGSLYLGLGAYAVGAGTVNIPGLVLAGNVSENFFGALVTRQVVRERRFASEAVRNDVLLRVAAAYLELLRAEGRHAIALQSREDARKIARITAEHADKGQGRKADADRAAAELEQRNNDVIQADEELLTASARLCELLNLDPSTRLQPVDGWVVPAPIVPDPIPLPELIAIALTQRPELKESRAAVRAALLQLHAARALPFSPNYILGYSAGTFGGGSDLASEPPTNQPRFDSFAPRQDLDVVVFWSLRNLGVGNLAMVRLSRSNLRSSELRQLEVLDRVRSEVAAAHARTHARYAQIETGERAVASSHKAFTADLKRIEDPKLGLPIETLDSFRLLARSRQTYLDAIIDYNVAHFELYVALGQPPADFLARPVPEDLAPPPAQAMPPK